MAYLTDEQVRVLLCKINKHRVGKNQQGQAHLEAYDVRAHLIRVFGFALWSGDVIDVTLLYEEVENGRVSVGYRCTYKLTIMGPDGFPLSTYTEAASGAATNFPKSKRGDAHDFAIKTAESQALKRCAINLGDQFGLSLYNGGSVDALVGRTLVPPASGAASNQPTAPVDDHVTEQLAPENAPEAPPEPVAPPQVDTPPPVPAAGPATTLEDQIRDKALNIPERVTKPRAYLTGLLMEASRSKVTGALVADGNGEAMTLEELIAKRIKEVAA